jgi:hypothetical protein
MLPRRTTLTLMLLTLVLAGPLCAADAVLEAVPADAAIVLKVKNPKSLAERLAKLADAVVEGSGQQLQDQSQMLGLLVANPTLEGVNMEGDWYAAAFLADPQSPPEVVFLVAASDAAKMKAAMPGEVKFFTSGKYGIYTGDEAAAEKIAARLKGTGKSINTAIDKASGALLDKGDLAVFINIQRLTEVFGDQIAGALAEARQNLENLPGELPPGAPAGFNPEQVKQFAEGALKAVEQGSKDLLSCAIAARVEEAGVGFEELLRFTANSATDKLFSKHKPSAMPNLALLPAGAIAYMGIQVDLPELMNLSMTMMKQYLGDNPDAIKAFDASLKEMSSLKYGSIVYSVALGDLAEGLIRMATITEVDSPKKMRELSQKMMKGFGTIEMPGFKQKVSYEPDAEKYGKETADLLKTEFEFEAGDPSAAMIGQMMQSFYGPEGMVARSVYQADKVVQTIGGGQDVMKSLLAALAKKPSASEKSATAKTRARLGEKANLVLLLDLPGTVVKTLKAVSESQFGMFLPINPEMIKELENESSYLGVAVATEAQGLRVNTHIPIEQIKGFAKLVLTMQETFGPGALGAPVEIQQEQ